jgi:hypothetical protein
MKISLFKHDIKDPIKLNLIKSVDAIITEWRLWPQITHTTPKKVMLENLEKISNLYKSFLSNTFDYFDKITICSTFPIYKIMDDLVWEAIEEHAEKLWFEMEMLEEQYTRPNQRIARGIFIATK